ncbi:MAG: hypothetical protein ACOC2H_01830 [Spirochaetota bacterium]
MIPRTSEFYSHVHRDSVGVFATKKEFDGNSYLKTREVNQLAEKFSNSGIYTEEISKILAKNILDGSVDIFA